MKKFVGRVCGAWDYREMGSFVHFPAGSGLFAVACMTIFSGMIHDSLSLFRNAPSFPHSLEATNEGDKKIKIRRMNMYGMRLRRNGFVCSNLLFPVSLLLSRAGVTDTCRRRQKSGTSARRVVFFGRVIDAPFNRPPIYAPRAANCIESGTFWVGLRRPGSWTEQMGIFTSYKITLTNMPIIHILLSD